jgi:hypothetical protein
MADRSQAKDAVAADLRSLAEDLKALVEDPKKRARKEWQWRLLYGVLALGFTMASRQLAAKAWAILTGEQPPTKGGAPTRAPRREPTATAAGGPH